MTVSEKEYESYKRNHNYDNPTEVEEGKIKKETKNNNKLRKKSNRKTQNLFNNIRKLSDFDESTYEEIEKINFKAKKEMGNAKTHKNRLKKLKKHKDFD